MRGASSLSPPHTAIAGVGTFYIIKSGGRKTTMFRYRALLVVITILLALSAMIAVCSAGAVTTLGQEQPALVATTIILPAPMQAGITATTTYTYYLPFVTGGGSAESTPTPTATMIEGTWQGYYYLCQDGNIRDGSVIL